MANFVLGSGRVYLERDATRPGEGVLIAETPAFSYSVKATTAEEMTNDGPIAEVGASAPTKVERTGKFTCKDISSYNLALFTIGAVATVSTTTGAVTSDPVNGGVALAGDRYYQLGLAAAPKVGVRGISSLALKTGETTYVSGTAYIPDLALGRIYVPAGSPMIGSIVAADYTRPTASREQVQAGNTPVQGALRFVSDNTVGDNRDYLFPAVTLYPSGDASLKDRQKFTELAFEFVIYKPSSGYAVYIDGRAVVST